MNISSLVELIDGRLKNDPSISFIANIHTDLFKVKQGDLFISNNQEEINQAIKLGAFGIVYEELSFIKITDFEIAWISVSSTEQTLIKIIRYLLSCMELNVFNMDEVTFDIFKLCSQNQNIIILNNDLRSILQTIQNINHSSILLSTNKILLQNIYPTYKNFTITNHPITNVTIHSIFETTFSYKDILFSRVKIPFLYIDIFLSVIEYLKIQNPLEIHGLKKWNILTPIFINKSFKPIDFGRSDKFIISNKSINRSITALSHIQRHFRYGKVVVLIHEQYKNNLKKSLFYQTLEELEFFIKTLNYNLLYIIGANNEEVIQILQKNKNEVSLFDY